MPGDYLEIDQIRESLASREAIVQNGFNILSNIARLVDEDEFRPTSQELILRALENKKHFGDAGLVLDALVRQVGLFPYLNPEAMGTADQIAWEMNRPANMPDEIVFHSPQTRVYRSLLQGKNVVLSAPTSFGKSLVTDAVIASDKYKNVLIVVPTIALIDETRRRLAQRFRNKYKIITHGSQGLAARNIFVLTQERVLEREIIKHSEFVVIDEFYKLAPGRDEDSRCARLNEVFYRVVKAKKQFYLLGPNVQGISENANRKLEYDAFVEEYRTVVSEIHNVSPGPAPLKTLSELCRSLKDPTIIFCSSPGRATEVVQALIASLERTNGAADAATWVAENYHPEWHFVKALRHGIGVHHGRIPRALAHYVVRAFNSDVIRFLVCTSTLIEGVNTKAKNVIIYDDKINKNSIDFFTFNNIKGRSGRMGKHFIGHVYLFHQPPSDPLPFVDIPAFSQPDNAEPSLLIQIDREDLTTRSKRTLEPFVSQEFLDYETLKANAGIDPQSQIELAKEIRSDLKKYHPLLFWKGIPSYRQIYGICNLIWKPFKCSKLGNGSAVKPNQLGIKIIALQGAPSIKSLIEKEISYREDADESVQKVLDFLRLWATFHFPQLLRALDRIQRDVFKRVRMPAGNYEVYAARVENLFTDSELMALEEYGIPLQIAKKLRTALLPYENLDQVLDRLRKLRLENTNLSGFERNLVRDTQLSL
jgi:DEAD/DEAH box helicase/Helicase conserved C-terminal domain